MEQKYFTLSQLCNTISEAIELYCGGTVLLVAEISELHVARGHCYLNLVEKNEEGNDLIAQQRATIWASRYQSIKHYFEQSTGVPLAAGIKVMIEVEVNYHCLYGLSLNVLNIEPEFTIGAVAMNRKAILERLMREGVVDMNKQQQLATVPKRIAVISSASAAGYGDFCNHLSNNIYGYHFITELFDAAMQGVNTEASVIAALERIYAKVDQFDAVVIIRGGGGVSDLSAFDNYEIAANISQFPLPIVSGIGHQRDETIVDLVSFLSVKTPTAAADFFIQTIHNYELDLIDLQNKILLLWSTSLESHKKLLDDTVQRISFLRYNYYNRRLVAFKALEQQTLMAIAKQLEKKLSFLDIMEQRIVASNPIKKLQNGMAYIVRNGQNITSTNQLKQGDEVTIVMRDGELKAVIK